MNQRSVKINFILNSILTMSSFIFPLITFPYVSRILTPVGTGKVSFATSIISYFAILSQLGIPTYGVRVCAQIRDDKNKLSQTVQELFIINIIMCIISYLFFIIALFNVSKMCEDKPLFIIISISLIFNTIGMEWLYKSLEQYTYITIRSIAFKIIAILMMFLFVRDENDYVIYGGITIFASSASSIFNCINIRKFINVRPTWHYNLKRHIKPILVFLAMSCATVIYTHLDIVMLGFMKTDVDVGYYNAAVRIKTILVSIVTSMGAVLLPRSSYYIEHGFKTEFLRISKKAITFVFLTATPLMVYFVLYAKEGIYFLSGRSYSGAIIPMQWIMPTILFIGLSNIMGIQMLIPLGREKIVLFSEIVGAFVNIMCNIILIPKFGSTGAAIGTLVAEFMVTVVQFVVLKDVIFNIFYSIQYLKIFLALLLGTVASLWMKYLQINNFTILIISASIFFSIYIVSLIIMKEPMIEEIKKQILSKLIRKNKKYFIISKRNSG